MPRSASPSSAALAREERAKEKARSDRAHERYVRRTYGLEEGQYQAMLQMQDGRCAICTRRARTRRLAVDHDHDTQEVRGLLCYTCNHFVLGFVEFDPIAAHNAAVYLAKIARNYGPEYDPFPVSRPLVEAKRPTGRELRMSTRPVKVIRHNDDLPF